MVRVPRRKGKISIAKLRVLGSFVDEPYRSTYSISKSLNKLDKFAYQNIRKIVLKLRMSDLITPYEPKWNEKLHGAEYYKLTDTGILELLVNDSISLCPDGWKRLIKYYGDNIIIKSFLNPIMERRTSLRLTSPIIIDALLDFLKKCCKELELTVAKLQNNDELTMPLFAWEEIPSDKESIKLICVFLRSETGIDFSKAKIKKSVDGNSILVSCSNNVANMVLDNINRKVIVNVNQKFVCELLLGRDTEYYKFNNSKVPLTSVSTQIELEESKKVITEQFESEINHHLFAMSSALIVGLTPLQTLMPSSPIDYKCIASDKRMFRLFRETKFVVQEGFKFISKSKTAPY